MRISVIGDLHMCRCSSIVRGNGKEYTQRLENCIKTLDWVERESESNGCTMEIFLGDFFDRPELDSETITAVKSVRWNNIEKHFIVGNHEADVATLEYNSANLLSRIGKVESSRRLIGIDNGLSILMLPYESEDCRKPLDFNGKDSIIAFSHNDIKGIRYGAFESKTGFSLDEIESNFRLFINGHLHNGSWVREGKVLNLGNITGLNFSEDASTYEHHMAIIDTDTMSIEFIANPVAFNFQKIDVDSENDLIKLKMEMPNSVISVRCEESLAERAKEIISSNNCIFTSRMVTYSNSNADTQATVADTIDHLSLFRDFVLERLGNMDAVKEELMEVCR